jgi:hypothetical protein
MACHKSRRIQQRYPHKQDFFYVPSSDSFMLRASGHSAGVGTSNVGGGGLTGGALGQANLSGPDDVDLVHQLGLGAFFQSNPQVISIK